MSRWSSGMLEALVSPESVEVVSTVGEVAPQPQHAEATRISTEHAENPPENRHVAPVKSTYRSRWPVPMKIDPRDPGYSLLSLHDKYRVLAVSPIPGAIPKQHEMIALIDAQAAAERIGPKAESDWLIEHLTHLEALRRDLEAFAERA